jgi:hypothetical protein
MFPCQGSTLRPVTLSTHVNPIKMCSQDVALGIENTPAGCKVFRKWEHHTQKWLESRGVSRTLKPWTSQDPAPRSLPRGKRELALVDCAWVARLQLQEWVSVAEARKDFFVDLHDSVQREPWGSLKTLKQQSTYYSYEHEYIMSANDHFAIQGWPNTMDTSMFTELDLKAMSGEAFALSSCAIALVSFYMNPEAPWWK